VRSFSGPDLAARLNCRIDRGGAVVVTGNAIVNLLRHILRMSGKVGHILRISQINPSPSRLISHLSRNLRVSSLLLLSTVRDMCFAQVFNLRANRPDSSSLSARNFCASPFGIHPQNINFVSQILHLRLQLVRFQRSCLAAREMVRSRNLHKLRLTRSHFVTLYIREK
jgi:hypothetical protein